MSDNSQDNNEVFNDINIKVNFDSIPEAEIFSNNVMIPKDLAGRVSSYRVIEEKYWYWDEKAAASFLALNPSKKYNPLETSLEHLDKILDPIMDFIIKHFSVKDTLPSIDFIALGVGSATKEIHILTRILNGYGPPTKIFNPIHYYPIDISFPLLQNSIRAVLSEEPLRDYFTNNRLVVAPFLTDYLINPPNPKDLGYNQKLFSALGIVWNAPMQQVLESLNELMDEDDLLLIDVEFVANRNENELKEIYSSPAVRDFIFHPLELLQLVASHDQKNKTPKYFESVIKPKARIPYRKFSPFTLKNGIIQISIEDIDSIDKFMNDYDIPSVSKGLITISPSNKSKTTMMLYNPSAGLRKTKQAFPVILAYSTRYDLKEFENYIKNRGFSIRLRSLLNKDKKADIVNPLTGYYLLQKGTSNSSTITIGFEDYELEKSGSDIKENDTPPPGMRGAGSSLNQQPLKH